MLETSSPSIAQQEIYQYRTALTERFVEHDLAKVPGNFSSVAAVQSCFCFIIVAAVIVLGIGALFLLFVLLYSQRVSSQSCETLGELLHHPEILILML